RDCRGFATSQCSRGGRQRSPADSLTALVRDGRRRDRASGGGSLAGTWLQLFCLRWRWPIQLVEMALRALSELYSRGGQRVLHLSTRERLFPRRRGAIGSPGELDREVTQAAGRDGVLRFSRPTG